MKISLIYMPSDSIRREMHKSRGKTTRSLGTALLTQPISIGEESVDSTRSS